MTRPAAFPAVVLRVLRTAAGWRVRQVGLLVGGLFVLGFLCGGQAQAADGDEGGALHGGEVIGRLVHPLAQPRPTDAEMTVVSALAGATRTATATPTDSATRPVGAKPTPAKPSAPAKPKPPAPTEPGHASGDFTEGLGQPDDDTVLRPVTEDLVGTVSDHVVRPVGDLVETVTSGLAETVGIPPLAALPGLPTLPESPSWPTLPTLPGLPTPTLPGIPGQTLPAPVTSASQPQAGGAAGVKKPVGDEGSVGEGAVYGPRFVVDGTVTQGAADHEARRSASSVHVPAHRAPADQPGGALGGKSAVDNGSSRHSDAHAVTLDHRAPLRLVPGAAAGVDAAGTRDRHRDIPVFPG
ncbi:hypothetical protein [Streptomyces sp. SID13726]|uniref:hypothetical protein n=1 Tax=Streptomyces sp. SID13726 TaxID=2706058 RepID=UPI0013B5C3D3|nr:hypothetical protein [Streptomyces sp. SID13726]NEA99874.1 hypothetical protein [Streptomyces sp. SID13726]